MSNQPWFERSPWTETDARFILNRATKFAEWWTAGVDLDSRSDEPILRDHLEDIDRCLQDVWATVATWMDDPGPAGDVVVELWDALLTIEERRVWSGDIPPTARGLTLATNPSDGAIGMDGGPPWRSVLVRLVADGGEPGAQDLVNADSPADTVIAVGGFEGIVLRAGALLRTGSVVLQLTAPMTGDSADGWYSAVVTAGRTSVHDPIVLSPPD